MLITKTGSKLWRYAYSFDAKQKLLAIGQYPLALFGNPPLIIDRCSRLMSSGR
jgi:hypothetical protein